MMILTYADNVGPLRGNILFRKFHMRSVSVKLKLFNSYCASMYTLHLWWNYKKMSICKLQITYHNILKMKIGLSKYESTSATCAITNTQCCQSVNRNIVYKFVCRLDNHCERVTFLQHCILFKNTFPLEGAALCSWLV